MWGNKLGWILAGAMVVLMVLTIGVAYVISSKQTSPTIFTQDEVMLAELQLPVDPKGLLPEQTQDGDARDVYWRAIGDYAQNANEYERLATTFDMKTALGMEGVGAMLEAAPYGRATLFDGKAEAAVGYGTRPGVGALHKVGGVCARIGTEYARLKSFPEAKRYLNATYVLGYHLYTQRMSRLQLSAGLGLMAHSATVLKQIASAEGNKEEAAKYERFVSGYQQYYKDHIEPMERVITSVDPTVQSEHVGDVFVIVDKSAERVWRVEGALKLGMYKYNTNTAGDRRAAIRKVKSLLADPDPAIAAAALAAKELTLEQYRTIGAK